MSVAMKLEDTTEATSDDALVEQYRSAGERACADELLKRHLGRIWNVVNAMVTNAADTDDIVQDVALKAFRGLDQFRGQSSFSTWIHRIAVNTTLRFLDQRKRLPRNLTVNECASTRELRPSANSHSTPEAAAINVELEQALQAGIASLKPSLRTVIALVVIDGMPPQQVAEIEGCSVNTIYWRVHEARKALQVSLAEYLS